jgi:predicted ATPase
LRLLAAAGSWFFEERCQKQGIFIFDEPQSALSPARPMEFLKLMRRMEQSTICQIVMARTRRC